MYRVLLKTGTLLGVLISLAQPASAVEVYLFRGAGDFSFLNKNLHFSRGIDKMARKLNEVGIHSRSTRWENTAGIYREIKNRRPQSVAFIGHSMGALAAMGMAKRMRKLGIRVAYVGLIDIPGPIGGVGRNVELAENFYHAFPVYGMLAKPKKPPRHYFTNHYVFGQIHVSMDDSSLYSECNDFRDLAAPMIVICNCAMPVYASSRAALQQEAVDTTITSSIGQFGRRVANGFSKLRGN